MKFVIAVIIFSAIILIHELGHFLLAKKNGIIVTEFSLGMGPRLLSTVKGGTRYSLKLFPIGGSCAMLGEDTTEEDVPGTFNRAPVWGRISVVAAGPVFNFILAFILSVIITGFVGYDPAQIMTVESGSTAEQAGIREGDIITEYNGYHIDVARDLYVYTYLNQLREEPVTVTVDRNGEELTFTFMPDVDVRYLLGFNRSDADSMKVESLIEGMPLEEAGLQPGDVITSVDGVLTPDGAAYAEYLEENPLSDRPVEITYDRNGTEYSVEITPREYRTPGLGFSYNTGYTEAQGFEVLKYAALDVKYMIRTTLLSLKELVTGGLGMDDLSGPVGVVDAIGTAYEETTRDLVLIMWMNLLNMAVLLSANLGVMNLLPLPALDGGRLVFLLLEAVRRRPVNREVEGMVHFAGLMLLMVLMVVVMYNDILKIV